MKLNHRHVALVILLLNNYLEKFTKIASAIGQHIFDNVLIYEFEIEVEPCLFVRDFPQISSTLNHYFPSTIRLNSILDIPKLLTIKKQQL